MPGTLTIAILTLNEEINLQRCLDSVAWADGRVVIDSGSSDKTLEIARRNQVRTLVNPLKPFSFSAQRNWALDHAGFETDWILFLDADEVVTPELRQELARAVTSAGAEVTAFQLTPKFMFLGQWLKHCQGYPSWHDRLVRRGRVRYGGGMWEHFVTEGQIGQIETPYLHYGLSKGIGEWFIKHENYASFDAEDVLISLGLREAAGEHQRTLRKRRLRDLTARVWLLRPFIRFTLMYVVRRGFLDGIPGLLYCLMMLCYEYMIVLKVIERRRQLRHLPI